MAVDWWRRSRSRAASGYRVHENRSIVKEDADNASNDHGIQDDLSIVLCAMINFVAWPCVCVCVCVCVAR